MDVHEAYEVLGLRPNATPEEADAAFVALSQKYHPDTPTGDVARQQAIGEARMVLSKHFRSLSPIAPTGHDLMPLPVRQALAAYSAPSSTEQAREAERRSVAPVQIAKWGCWVCSIAGLAMVSFANSSQALSGLASTVAGNHLWLIASAVLGTTGLMLQAYVLLHQWRTDRFMERISDKVECARQLAELLQYADADHVPESDLLSPGWLAPVLVRRAVEHGLLVPDSAEEIAPGFIQTYSLAYRPSAFTPAKPTPSAPPTPSEPEDPLPGAITGGVVSIGLGVWAALAGIARNWRVCCIVGAIAFLFLVAAVALARESLTLRRRRARARPSDAVIAGVAAEQGEPRQSA